MLASQFAIVSLAIVLAQLSDESAAEQIMLANVLAAGSEAQERCQLPGEAQAALNYVRGIQPAFDVVSDPGDGKAVFSALKNVRGLIRKIGARTWCDLYLLDRPELMRGKERSEYDGDLEPCDMSVALRLLSGWTARPYWQTVSL